MMNVREPNSEKYRELRRMKRQEVGRVSQRSQMVLHSASGKTVPEIGLLFQVCQPTVRHWLKHFNRLGPAGLQDQPRSGRPRKVTEKVSQHLLSLMQDDPQKEGYLATFWTVAMLVMAVSKQLQVHLSASTVRATIRRLELHWGRPRLRMPNKVDPEKASKQWKLVKAVVEASAETVILCADESRIKLLPLLTAMWHWAGQQIRVPTSGNNVNRSLFVALNIRTREWSYLVRPKMRKEDFIAFLEHLLGIYPNVPIILVVDNYSSHTAHLVQEWLLEHPKVDLHFLSKYCSHLNPVEPIWLRLKNKIAANRLYADMQLLLESVDAFFNQMSPEKALLWAHALN